MIKQLVFSLMLLLTFAGNVMAQSSTPVTSNGPVLLVDDHKSATDTCALFVNLTTPTTDKTGLILQGTDLLNALVFTRCACNVTEAKPLPGETFLTFALYTNVIQIVTQPWQKDMYTVWIGNTTRALLKK